MRGSKSIVAEVAEVILLAVGLYLVINFAVQTVHVLGLSMFSTLDNDDYLIATKLDYRFHGPQRGDIVIMRDPFDPSKDFIKRVIALPGERLLIQEAHVYVNGQQLEEPYLAGSEPWTMNANWPLSSGSGSSGSGVEVPANSYFVMGDNRNHSSDSRLFGFVRRDQIEARAWIRIWPANRLGPVDVNKPRLTAAQIGRVSLAAS